MNSFRLLAFLVLTSSAYSVSAEDKVIDAVYACSYSGGEPTCFIDEQNDTLRQTFGVSDTISGISLKPATLIAELTGLDSVKEAKSNGCMYQGHAEFVFKSFEVEPDEGGDYVTVQVASINHDSGFSLPPIAEQVAKGFPDCKLH